MAVLNIISWNATGIMTGIPYLDNELDNMNIDICGISEHWLKPENSNILDNFNHNYRAHIVIDNDVKCFNNRRVGKGGVAILWHKRLDQFVQPIQTMDDRIAVIKLTFPNETLYIVQVYLPTSRYPIQTFKDYIDKLYDICSLYSNDGKVTLMGDFNAKYTLNPHTCTIDARERDTYMANSFHSLNLQSVTSLDVYEGPDSSFYPYGTGSPSLIDHMFIHDSMVADVRQCTILEDAPLNVSRHLPIFVSLNIQTINHSLPNNDMFTKTNYKWTSLQCNMKYKENLDILLTTQNIPFDNVNDAYDNLCECIRQSAETTLPKRKFKPYLKPYWSNELKQLHRKMKSLRNTWISCGQPRNIDNVSYRQYKDAKREFRRILRQSQARFEMEENNRIDNLAEIDQNGFWKAIN
ncbi:MAG: endonuclease/exonuclease/phosphatase family protein, partial [Sedimenticola sp.]